MSPLLGCIADDFTGGTDLANTLVSHGMRTIQTNGLPGAGTELPEADALVVSLKCRSIPADEAVRQCLAALAWLRQQGCRQFFWKYCSTFDSTPKGNIGPVAEALLEQLGGRYAPVCPAFPQNGRTVYKGRLFVGDVPLDESSMRLHPVTPMTDASLVRLLAPQVRGDVGSLPWECVHRGAGAVRSAIEEMAGKGIRFIVMDALEDADLLTLGEACADTPLLTGGSGLAMGLPENFRRKGLLPAVAPAAPLPEHGGFPVILSGSCSQATLGQLADFASYGFPSRQIDPFRLEDASYLEELCTWAAGKTGTRPVVIYASAEPAVIDAVQARLGKEYSGHLVEQALGRVAQRVVAAGARSIIVAGGESSGAVVQALGIQVMRIGAQIAPGVPWVFSPSCEGHPALNLALKSGNFGGRDFFSRALAMLPR